MMDIDFYVKKVLDLGCGTGILGILASMMGASQVFTIDIDNCACQNTIENAAIKRIENLIVIKFLKLI